MNGTIIVKGTGNKKVAKIINSHVEMLAKGMFNNVEFQPVVDQANTAIINVRCSKKRFEEIRKELSAYYPKKCMFIY